MEQEIHKSYPMISIVMPAYNSGAYIESSINSVVSQTLNSWELIIVDDCSVDNTVDIVNRYCYIDSRISLVRNSINQGAAESRNLAISKAKGRFIAFLDSDDLWMPRKLEIQVNYMLTNKDVHFTCSAYNVIDEENNVVSSFIPPEKAKYKDLLKTCSVGCSTVIYDCKALEKHYMPNIRRRQDYALWLKLLKVGNGEVYGIREYLASYRIGKSSLSSNKMKAALGQWKVYRQIERLTILRALYYFTVYAFNGMKKYK